MRIDVKKFLFVGMEEDRKGFFEKAQQLGVIQFIDEKKTQVKEVPDKLNHLNSAIKVLRGLPPVEQEELEDYAFADGVVKEILSHHDALEKLREKERENKLERARVAIFGDFSLEDVTLIEKQGKRHIQFFCAKENSVKDPSDELIYVDTDHGLDYFVSISQEPMQYDKMIEMHIEKPIGVLNKEQTEIHQAIHDHEKELKKYAKYNTYLHHALIENLNDYRLTSTQDFPSAALGGALFSVEGWIPLDKEELIKPLTDDLKVYAEEIAIEEKDLVPTYLENKGASRIGEDLVHIYDTPANTDKDPSLWVLVFFSLFFAIIVGDAGYGLIFLAAALYAGFKAKKITVAGKRFFKLAIILCSSCVIWGLLINSFFGIEFALNSPFRKVSLLQWLVNKKAEYHLGQKDEVYNEFLVKFPDVSQASSGQEFLSASNALDVFSSNILMELALLFGVIHICLSFLRYLGRNWAGAGWILAIIGAYLYFPAYLDATSFVHYLLGVDKDFAALEGLYLMAVGVPLALILSLIQNRLYGVFEITNSIQIFGDILSYLRLYALGLASAVISVTVNEMAAAAGYFFGVIILIFGHGVNMVLAIIGGVIHGLRLNFLEWYHYCFEGGGKLFAPLEKVKIE